MFQNIYNNIRMKILITEEQLKTICEVDFAHHKNRWYNLSPRQLQMSAAELVDMIIKSYADIGGHPEFQSPNNIATTDLNLWLAIDVDEDPEWDATLAGKTTDYGKKWTVLATDGNSNSRRSVVSQLIKRLKMGTNYIEASDRVAEILSKVGLPFVEDEDAIKDVIKKEDIKYVGDGWYERKIAGQAKLKRLFGKPKTRLSV